MASEYDRVEDPWYTHLFREIHGVLIQSIEEIKPRRSLRALDIGCGSGLQALLLAEAGFSVDAFDLSERLLELAAAKEKMTTLWEGSSTFEADMRRYHDRARTMRGDLPRKAIRFFKGDAGAESSYSGGPYDFIVCCGSVLSFVEDPDRTLGAMRGALRDGGRVVLECEMKSNLDLAWPLVDRLLLGRLGYEQSWGEATSNLLRAANGDLELVYPFELQDGTELRLPMRLFSHRRLSCRMHGAGLRVVRPRGVHALTNLIPSTVLHHPCGPTLSRAFGTLAWLERRLAGSWPIRRLGCSAIFELTNTESSKKPAVPSC
jgi:SAM-dependent methyltransferase